MMKDTIVGLLLLEIISPAVEQLLNRNGAERPCAYSGVFRGVGNEGEKSPLLGNSSERAMTATSRITKKIGDFFTLFPKFNQR